ncbi:hypothetical protein A2Y85_05030 [candidate division WOR-3 bacterium RBG_13_43_14]|uniref:HTH cro/C1-type domain-containing protein n=1 Tax=candidate division WOR-3 bacterium RBG_13_43_14 TaxID=1802590 RepID=A0A1F4UET8_UNCW3|nr:MAG: hypothetical protein A2Y85_05030 [candidate division WOR-3 bacterium RBG_13_43_14]
MQRNPILIKLARRVRQLRKINKMTQEELAEHCDLHFTYIGEIERCEKNPTIISLQKISQAFKISLTELLTFADEPRKAGSNIDTLNKALQLLDLAKKLGETEIKTK